MRKFWEAHEGLFILVGVAAAICLLCGGVIYVKSQGQYAEIQSLRGDVLNVSDTIGEDVMGQVTQWNQRIAMMRRFNSMPFVCLFIPNAWDEVEPIRVH